MKTWTPPIIQTVIEVLAEFLYHCTSWSTDYSTPIIGTLKLNQYRKAFWSHPIIWTIVVIKLANFEPFFSLRHILTDSCCVNQM